MTSPLSYDEAYANYKASIHEVTAASEAFAKLREERGLPELHAGYRSGRG